MERDLQRTGKPRGTRRWFGVNDVQPLPLPLPLPLSLPLSLPLCCSVHPAAAP